jgi:hypothetical protein
MERYSPRYWICDFCVGGLVVFAGSALIGTGGIGAVIIGGLFGAASGAAYYGYSHLNEEWDWSEYAESIVSNALIGAGITASNLVCIKLTKLIVMEVLL